MANSELLELIQRYYTKNDNTPIYLRNVNERRYAVNFLLHNSKGIVRLLVVFNERGDSDVIDAISDNVTVRNLTKYLKVKNNKLIILTNDAPKVRGSDVVQSLTDEGVSVEVAAIPKKLFETLVDRCVDNELVLIEPSKFIFLGKYGLDNTSKSEGVTSYLNFNDVEFYNILKGFFEQSYNNSRTGRVS
ncbi:TPA: hypothetical protein I7232_14315 [Vibrio vulnificus]|uniref:hypothetical protein n=1 Tax=Vibrio vulnificus TaxID=672 RepID=UPI001A24B6F1|nr:hypothetical protein [Vibrio vulnificus]HDY7606773.1 hypothetical protein [Vibrio vulnificus]